jgi:hypothetical protein
MLKGTRTGGSASEVSLHHTRSGVHWVRLHLGPRNRP